MITKMLVFFVQMLSDILPKAKENNLLCASHNPAFKILLSRYQQVTRVGVITHLFYLRYICMFNNCILHKLILFPTVNCEI